MKVFISSTVFDLLDTRAVVERALSGAGIQPMLSDSKLSAFDVTPSANSIETCLLNVDASDAFVCILDQRYGPSLKSAGFPDISATHLEYRRALEKNKPIHFFVRDRLEADYSIWKKNGRNNSTKLVWAVDPAILSFLDEHRKLDASTNRQNWFSTFSAATDLVDALSLRFDREMKPQIVLDAMRENRFPLLSCSLDVEQITVGNVPSLQLRFQCRNVSLSPAFSVRTEWQNETQKPTESMLPPGESITPTLIANLAYGGDISKDITVSYDTSFGVRVVEVHNVGVIFQGGHRVSIISGATLKDRRFIRSTVPQIQIEER
ncbi:MAG: DUF4062 domain-containing protein [Planctomycetaceae bacterium]|nr:DUF4062 domain-containing protein [Planctomycetaceae bacterium]